jgi:hypothetical protein
MLKPTIAFLVVLSVCFLVFSQTLGYDFVNWDDDIYVYDNAKIKSLGGEDISWWFSNTYYYAYIPLTMLSHALDYALFGLSARGHHLTNVILHSVNAGWVLLLGLVLFRRRQTKEGGERESWTAIAGMMLATFLYALHPLRVESVAWVSDRKDLLCVFFLLPSAFTYVLSVGRQDTRSGRGYLVLSFVLFVCALLSKSVAIGFPVVLLVLDWYLSSESDWKIRWKSLLGGKGWYFAASLVIGIVLLMISSGGKRAYAVEQLQGIEVALFPLYSFAFYLWKTLVPVSLSPIYPAVGTVELVAGFLTACGITVVTLWMAGCGKKGYLACWVVYLVFLFPTVVGLSSGMQPLADRFSYLPAISLFLGLGALLATLLARSGSKRRVVPGLVSLALVGGFATMSFGYSSNWASSETLWKYVVDGFPPRKDFVDAYVNLGAVYADRMELPEAERVLSEATRIDPDNADAFYNLAHVLYLRGEWEVAAGYFRKAMEIDTTYARAFFNYAVVSSQLGRDSLAIPAMRHAARLGFREAVDALLQGGIPLEEPGGTSRTK